MTYSLYLYPASPPCPEVNTHQLAHCLIENRLAVKRADEIQFQPGDKLMAFINFLGCSPALSSGHLDSLIKIHAFEQMVALGGESINALRYPQCKHRIENPTELLQGYPEHRDWTCPVCQNHGYIDEINWRKSAGFACMFIEISAIFPKEAVPTDALLALLKACTEAEWQWFYSRASF